MGLRLKVLEGEHLTKEVHATVEEGVLEVGPHLGAGVIGAEEAESDAHREASANSEVHGDALWDLKPKAPNS